MKFALGDIADLAAQLQGLIMKAVARLEKMPIWEDVALWVNAVRRTRQAGLSERGGPSVCL